MKNPKATLAVAILLSTGSVWFAVRMLFGDPGFGPLSFFAILVLYLNGVIAISLGVGVGMVMDGEHRKFERRAEAMALENMGKALQAVVLAAERLEARTRGGRYDS